MRAEECPFFPPLRIRNLAITDHLMVALPVFCALQQAEERETEPIGVDVRQSSGVWRGSDDGVNCSEPFFPDDIQFASVTNASRNATARKRTVLKEKGQHNAHRFFE